MSLFAGLDSPLEHGTGTWDWIIQLECGTGTLLERVSNKCNRHFHVRLRYAQGPIIERDITSGVHSSAILEYFTIAVNGK